MNSTGSDHDRAAENSAAVSSFSQQLTTFLASETSSQPLASAQALSFVYPLAGYQFTEQLYQGSRTAVYRATIDRAETDRRVSDQSQGDRLKSSAETVIIKVLNQEYPGFQDLVQFRNQYALSQDLDIPGVVRPLELLPYGRGYALIMEDSQAISLRDLIQSGTFAPPLPVEQVLDWGLQLTRILQPLHAARIIHKDIKPANLLLNPKTGQISLIDFSIASRLPKETQGFISPKGLEGTLAYLAPEQTGRMNRGIDYRSDFYALGVTLFELLTGQLPFTALDPMELVYCHLAQVPPVLSGCLPPTAEPLPPVLDGIIAKLLAKNAEDRYQSALGLQHDLEQCRQQCQQYRQQGHSLGTISPFPLGQQDRSDRFLISERLYGREREVERLLGAFDRISPTHPELVLVAGFSGIGKTAVIHEVHKPITQQQGYFCKGKFDQFQRNQPFSAVVQALADLLGQLLTESDAQLAHWRDRIVAAIADNGQLLIDLLPDLEKIIGPQPPVPDLVGAAAQSRFDWLFPRFIGALTQGDRPLVLFLDDLQWADLRSLQLLELLLQDASPTQGIDQAKGNGNESEVAVVELDQGKLRSGLLILGAYRDNEVFPAHPLTLLVSTLERQNIPIETLTLAPLNFDSLNQLVADTLGCDRPLAQPLTQLIYQKTQGNPFFATQFLQTLHGDGLITFVPQSSSWQCDLTQVQTAALTDDVVTLMAQRLRQLPQQTQTLLKLGACMGYCFDLETLALIAESSPEATAQNLWPALEIGLVLPQSEVYRFYLASVPHPTTPIAPSPSPHSPLITVPSLETAAFSAVVDLRYQFLHDRVQQAAYSLIAEADREPIHYQLGRLLWAKIPEADRGDRIFEIVNPLNIGRSLVTDAQERLDLAQLNDQAAQRARNATAYGAVRNYSEVALDLLGETVWQEHYRLALRLHALGAEAAALEGDFETMDRWIAAAMDQIRSPLDRVPLAQIQIKAFAAQEKHQAAVDATLALIAALGTPLPEQPTPETIGAEIGTVVGLLGDDPISVLRNLPPMTDPISLALMELAAAVIASAYRVGSPLFPLLVTLQVRLSLTQGRNPWSAFGYALLGITLMAGGGNIDLSLKIGQYARELALEPDSKVVRAGTLNIVAIFLNPRMAPLAESLTIAEQGYQAGLETGDLGFVGYNGTTWCDYGLWAGLPLPDTEPTMRQYYQHLLKLGQQSSGYHALIYWQMNLEMQDHPDRLDLFFGEAGQAYIDQKRSAQEYTWLGTFYCCRVVLKHWTGQGAEATPHLEEFQTYAHASMGGPIEVLMLWYTSLTQLLNWGAGRGTGDDPDWPRLRAEIAERQAKLRIWVDPAPMNHLHKWELVEAEQYRVQGQWLEAMAAYDRAIAAAQDSHILPEEAYCLERAAQFYLGWGKPKLAAVYLQDAYYAYAHWGAKRRTDALERDYPQLLQPILLQSLSPAALSSRSNQSVRTETLQSRRTSLPASAPSRSSLPSYGPSSPSSPLSLAQATSLSQGFDLTSLFLAAQTLAGDLHLDSLVSSLMTVLLQNAAAHKVALLLNPETTQQGLAIVSLPPEASLNLDQIRYDWRETENWSQSQEIPQKVMATVKNNRDRLLLQDGPLPLPWATDPYLVQHQPESLLGLPILYQGQLVALVYLENSLTRGAFTADRLQVLNLLSTQIAISLQNALLYERLDQAKAQLERSNRTLEDRVQHRTAELHQKNQQLSQALTHLKQAQAQLVQTEKLSALGRMVGGLAHEINNPVTFILGNLSHAEQYLQDLVALYQSKIDPAASLAQGEMAWLADPEECYLIFQDIQEDLPHLFQSMERGARRIHGIVESLRQFSRLDEQGKKWVDLRSSLVNTLTLLESRLEAQTKGAVAGRPEIDRVETLGVVPALFCDGSNLNQIWLNLLSNSLDALDEYYGCSQAQPEQYPPRSVLRLELSLSFEADRNIVVRLRDNGMGMTAETQKRAFDPFFTTKPVGQGTGLGLSVVYTTVTQLGGTIAVESTWGEGTTITLGLPAQATP